jgi:hypothetical protein
LENFAVGELYQPPRVISVAELGERAVDSLLAKRNYAVDLLLGIRNVLVDV